MKRFTALFVAAVAVLFPARPAASEVVHACIAPGGSLRIAGGPGDCRRRETPVSWHTSGPRLAVFDASGDLVGPLIDREGDDGSSLRTFLPGIGEALLFVRNGMLTRTGSHPQLVYEEIGCTGPAYTEDVWAGRVAFAGQNPSAPGRLWVGDVQEPPRSVGFVSEWVSSGLGPGMCVNGPGAASAMIPATEIDAADLGLPRPAPLYVDLIDE